MGTPSQERLEVLQTIKNHGPITTLQIANRLMLTTAETSKIVQNLSQAKLIKLLNKGEGYITATEWETTSNQVGVRKLTNANGSGTYTGEELQTAVRPGAMEFKLYPSLFGGERRLPK